jgi:hypothetical protein
MSFTIQAQDITKTVWVKVTSYKVYETKDTTITYQVMTDRGIMYYTTTKPKIGEKVKINGYKKH